MVTNEAVRKLKKERENLLNIKIKLSKIDESLDKSIDNNPEKVLQKLEDL